jgi:RNA polymerase subunit RPABC4/transcription elongation factor Spt4
MSGSAEDARRSASRRMTPGVFTCPSCAGPLGQDSKWCPNCHFTGGDCVQIFPDSPPPLLPILDAAGLFNDRDIQKIESARSALSRRFPQFRWKICTIFLPPEKRLPLFGFWLINVCPFHKDETLEERAWTILLLINASNGQVAAVPGYAAEPVLSDDEWKDILGSMSDLWSAGKPADAVVQFFKSGRDQLNKAWRRYGSRRRVS